MNTVAAKKVKAMVHSLNSLAEVTIISEKDNNHVIAEYNGQKCTAVNNPFSGYYYVDDIYGVIKNDDMMKRLQESGY